MKGSISLIIPAYNEEERISRTVKAYYTFLLRKFEEFELIVVCNNCSDQTPKIVKGFEEKYPALKCLNFPHYTGKGGAVLEGFKESEFELIGFVDADNSTPPNEFEKIIKKINDFDIAIGSRGLKESVLVKPQAFFRRFLGKSFGFIARHLFGLNVRDTQCGAKVFKKKVIEKILPSIKTRCFSFDVELLWRAKRNGFKIKEVPIKWKNSEESKVGLLEPLAMLLQLLRLRFLE